MTEKELMFSGKLYHPYKVQDNPWEDVRAACKKFNEADPREYGKAMEALKPYFAKAEDDLILTPPFFCDHGDRISFGKHFYANTGLTILDENTVVFGDDVFLGPHVSIYTAGHPISAEVRNLELEYAWPVKVGSSVWIGGNTVINPGVTIGDDVVIGSGSVVTKDIPSHVVAAGNPCRVIREITEEDHKIWKTQLEEIGRASCRERVLSHV